LVCPGRLRGAIAALSFFAFACGPAVEIRGELKTGSDGGASTLAGLHGDGGPSGPLMTLDDVRTQIFMPSCATSGCHAPPMPPLDLDLSLPTADLAPRLRQISKQSLAKIPLITPNAYGSSYLYLKVFLATPVVGDQMPPSAPLDARLIEDLRTWIQAGAP
jgi:hypothetical protein